MEKRASNPSHSRMIAVIAVLLGVYSSRANAGIYVETTFLPAYTQSNTGVGSLGGNFSGGSLSSESGFSYDLRATIGYVYSNILLGFSYNIAQAPLSRTASADAASLDRNTTGTQMGASLGYMFGKVRLVASYLFLGTKKRTEKQVQSDGTVLANYSLENKGGSGFQVTVGYDFNISGSVKIGPSLVYSNIRYNTQTLANEVDPSGDYKNKKFTTKAIESALNPMISLTADF